MLFYFFIFFLYLFESTLLNYALLLYSVEIKNKNALIAKCYLILKVHSTEQTAFWKVFPSGTHFTAESTEVIRIKCLAQGHDIQMLPGFEPSIAMSRNGYLTNMTNILQYIYIYDVDDFHELTNVLRTT